MLTNKSHKDTLTYQPGEFIVKCQGNVGKTPILVYNKERSFTHNIDPDSYPNEFNQIMTKAKSIHYSESPYPGFCKFFLYACTTKQGLKLFLDKQAPWQDW